MERPLLSCLLIFSQPLPTSIALQSLKYLTPYPHDHSFVAHHQYRDFTMSKSGSNQVLLWGGMAAAGGVGYYLYNAGGSPKVAEKQFEGTLHLWTIALSSYFKLCLLCRLLTSNSRRFKGFGQGPGSIARQGHSSAEGGWEMGISSWRKGWFCCK